MSKYRIVTDFPRPDPALIKRAEGLYYCLLGCRVGPRQVVDPGIKPLERSWRLCGPAFTAKPEHTNDTLMGQIAGKYLKPGDVLVVDARGDATAAAFGATMASAIKQAGGAGIVVDGYILTAEVIRAREGIPLFCRGTVPYTATSDKPGWLNVPAVCGGVIVNPGDLVVGDEDGVLVIPFDQIEDTIAHVEKMGTPRPRDGVIPPRVPNAEPYYRRSGAEKKIADRTDVNIISRI
ncbi:MAG: RraA family protein [Alphaproteobacteria bacterium]|nr:RraA family protein [Alphaproteobacteria bacterium]